ncbi:MAG TPA: copper chaperone PCu(A)C [Caulobacteraceae bacterium]|nr:copper chaperone PCu(A)C [Caulobacteraceae bacterium]
MRLAHFALAAALAVSAPALAHSYKKGELAIGHPWSRPAAAGMNGAGYLSVTNNGKAADVLVAVESPAAATVEIHEASTAGGVMRMRKLPDGLAIAPGATVSLKPGGNHLMLLKLKRPLKVGDKVAATLVFKRAGRVKVSLSVQAAPAAAGGHDH